MQEPQPFVMAPSEADLKAYDMLIAQTVALNRDERIEIEHVTYTFDRINNLKRLEFTQRETGQSTSKSVHAFKKLFVAGRVKFLDRLEKLPECKQRVIDIPESMWSASAVQRVKNSEIYCKAIHKALQLRKLRSTGSTSLQRWIDELPPVKDFCPGLENHPSRGKLQRDYKNFKDNAFRRSIFIHGNTNPNRKSVLHDFIQMITLEVVETFLLPNPYCTLEMAQAEIQNEIDNYVNKGNLGKGTKAPALSTIRDVVKSLSQYERLRISRGHFDAEHLQKPRNKMPIIEDIGMVWECDHTLLDVPVGIELFDTNGIKQCIELGKVWLTAIIDTCSRMIVAMVIGIDPPSTERSMAAVRMALGLAEDAIPEGIKYQVSLRCIPDYIVLDNGPDYHSKDFLAALNELGITVIYARAWKGEDKAYIERFFLTLKILLLPIFGTSGTNSRKERASGKRKARKPVPMKMLIEGVWKLVCETYHIRQHGGLSKATPWDFQLLKLKQVADRAANHEPSRIRMVWELPSDLLAHTFTRRKYGVRNDKNGVVFEKNRYQSRELGILRDNDFTNVDIRVAPDDVGYAYVYDPCAMRWLKVPNVDLQYKKGISLAVDKKLYARAREYHKIHDPEGRLPALSSKQYMKNYRDVLRGFFEYADKPWRHRKREFKFEKLQAGKAGDIATLVNLLDHIDMLEGRIPPESPYIDLDLLENGNGLFSLDPDVRKTRERSKPTDADGEQILLESEAIEDLDLPSNGEDDDEQCENPKRKKTKKERAVSKVTNSESEQDETLDLPLDEEEVDEPTPDTHSPQDDKSPNLEGSAPDTETDASSAIPSAHTPSRSNLYQNFGLNDRQTPTRVKAAAK